MNLRNKMNSQKFHSNLNNFKKDELEPDEVSRENMASEHVKKAQTFFLKKK